LAASRTSFEKLQRDRAKKAKAAVKRERRQERAQGEDPTTTDDPALSDPSTLGEGELSAPDLLRMVAAIHEQFDAGTISFDEFEERKTELLARLPVD
jgi:hypothetical protein